MYVILPRGNVLSLIYKNQSVSAFYGNSSYTLTLENIKDFSLKIVILLLQRPVMKNSNSPSLNSAI